MVFVLKVGTPQTHIDLFIRRIEAEGFSTILSRGTEHTHVNDEIFLFTWQE